MNHNHRKDDDKMKFCLVTVGKIDKKPYAHKFIHMMIIWKACLVFTLLEIDVWPIN